MYDLNRMRELLELVYFGKHPVVKTGADYASKLPQRPKTVKAD